MRPPGKAWSRHPGLHLVLDKVHRGKALSEAEIEVLHRQLGQAEGREPGPVVGGPERTADKPGSPSPATDFIGSAQGLRLSSVGVGTYRGPLDEETDASYVVALHAAMRAGITLVDTSLNYRHQRAERNVAQALRHYVEGSGGSRDDLVLCSKGGFLLPGAFDASALGPGDVVDGMHSLAPTFLVDQLLRSRRNLEVETIDVYYLHNPEVQLEHVGRAAFLARLRAAFEVLETAAADGVIRFYGTATWTGYRDGSLRLPEMVAVAEQVAGPGHRFRFIQLPVNLGMREAFEKVTSTGGSVLDDAADLGITVIASAALLQARLVRDLPAPLVGLMPGLETDAQRAVQFARSVPGVAAALIGMRRVEQVRENVAVARVPKLNEIDWRRVLDVI